MFTVEYGPTYLVRNVVKDVTSGERNGFMVEEGWTGQVVLGMTLLDRFLSVEGISSQKLTKFD
jgi:hypothetical protein